MRRRALFVGFLGIAVLVASRFCPFREAHATTRAAIVDSVESRLQRAVVDDEAPTDVFIEPSAPPIARHVSTRPRPKASSDRDDPPPWPAPVGPLPSAWR